MNEHKCERAEEVNENKKLDTYETADGTQSHPTVFID